MHRRNFITLLGGLAASWPRAASAQEPAKPMIGFLRPTSPSDSARLLAAWHEGLKAGGYVEGQNVAVEYRWAENHLDRLPALAAELVRDRVAIIVGAGNAAAHAAKAATDKIPIVFAVGEDPVKTGLVASLNRPGGNATGATFITLAVATKKLQLLSELTSKSTSIAYLFNPKNPQTELELKEAQTAARSLGLQNSHSESRCRKRHRCRLRDGSRLMSYGPSLPDTYRQAGLYVGRILQGANPAQLPVQQPTKFAFVINLKTAKALGLTVPPTMQIAADEVIE